MTIEHHHDGESIPIPRGRVFVLADGTFVVQWEENRVQVLLSGRYLPYNEENFGNPITNYELGQLKQAGVVDSYDQEFVHLCPLPSIIARTSTRAYYLNTILPISRLPEVEDFLMGTGLTARFSARMHDKFVIIRAEKGLPFVSFDDAEKAREALYLASVDMFRDAVVAFVEIVSP